MTPNSPSARSLEYWRSRRVFSLLMSAWFIALACGVLDGPSAAGVLGAVVLASLLVSGFWAGASGHVTDASAGARGGDGANYRQPTSEAWFAVSEPDRARLAKARWRAHGEMLLLVTLAALLLLAFAIDASKSSPGRGPAGADFSLDGIGTFLYSLACGMFVFLYASITTLIVGGRPDATPRGIAAMHLTVAVAVVVAAVFGLMCL